MRFSTKVYLFFDLGLSAFRQGEGGLVKAIILAAGRGSRMQNLTDAKPKCLLEVRGRTLLDWQLSALADGGVSEVAIVTGYKREMFAGINLPQFHNERWSQTNMVSSLACAHEWLEQGPCIVSYSDIFFGAEAVRDLIQCSAPLAITYDLNWERLWDERFEDPLLDAETFRVSQEGTLLEIGKKPQCIGEIQGQYMGLLKFSPDGWKELMRIWSENSAKTKDAMQMTRALQQVIEADRIKVLALSYEGEWGEIDSPTDLALYDNR